MSKAKSVKQATQATQAKSVKQATVAPVAVVAAPVVALRGGPAVASVTLTGKPYRTKAVHNAGWWALITANKGGSVAALIAAGVPAHFVGYTVRRGYLLAAA